MDRTGREFWDVEPSGAAVVSVSLPRSGLSGASAPARLPPWPSGRPLSRAGPERLSAGRPLGTGIVTSCYYRRQLYGAGFKSGPGGEQGRTVRVGICVCVCGIRPLLPPHPSVCSGRELLSRIVRWRRLCLVEALSRNLSPALALARLTAVAYD